MLSPCPSLPENSQYLSVSVIRHPLVEEGVSRFGLGQETDYLINLLSLFKGLH